MVLLVVLVVLVLLALAANAYTSLMFAENKAAFYSGRRMQARVAAESGIETALWFLSQADENQVTYGGHYNNPDYFNEQVVYDDGAEQGKFIISAPSFASDGTHEGPRFGLQDESAKINLNALLLADQQQENGARELLMKALGKIGMTESLADKILDFIDEDDDPREFGAEAESYQDIRPKNRPLESLEELLLVQEVTWQLLFGRDVNRNGQIDTDEEGLGGSFYDDQGAQAQRGWSAFLTIYSAEKNLNPQGKPKIDLNNNDLKDLYDQLVEVFDAEWATYIVAYRQNGPMTEGMNDQGGNDQGQVRTGGLDFDRPGRARLNNVLDLVGVKVSAQFKDEQEAVLLKTPFPDPAKSPGEAKVSLPKLFDYAAVNVSPVIPGRININVAPKLILDALPGLAEERREIIVNQILSLRDPELQPADSDKRHETWLLTDVGLTLDEMKQLLPFVCVRGSVYRADVLGLFDDGPAARIEAILDASRAKPRVLFWRDISHLGTKAALDAARASTSN